MGRLLAVNSPSAIPKRPTTIKTLVAIVELGAATSWNFSGGAATFAPNLAAEITPVENWLELEAGVSPFFTRNDGMGHRPALQETVDHIAESRVYVGRRSPVGSPQAERESEQFHSWGSRGRFYVLANRQTSLRLVS